MTQTQLLFRDGQAHSLKAISDIPGLITNDLRPFDGSINGLGKAYKQSIWAYRAVTLKADMFAGIPLKLWTLDAEGNETEVDEHPLLGDDALGYGATRTLRDTALALDIYGRAFLWPQPGALGASMSLKWLNPRAMRPRKDPASQQIIGWDYRPVAGSQIGAREFDLDELITLSLFDPESDYGGLSPLAVAIVAAGADVSTVRYVESFFANSARPDGILTTDQMLNEADVKRIQSWWDRLFRGVRNAFRTAVTYGGLKWTPMQSAAKDVALAEVRDEIRTDICVALGVPPALVIANQKYSNYEQARKSIYHETLMPRCDFVADELNRQLVKPYYGDEVYLAYDYSDIEALQEDATARFTRAGLALQSGGTLNDALHLMGLDTIEGEEGETRYIAMGVKPLNAPEPEPAPAPFAPPAEDETDDEQEAGEQEAAEDESIDPTEFPAKRALALAAVRGGETVTLWGRKCATSGQVRAAFERHWPKPVKAAGDAAALLEMAAALREATKALAVQPVNVAIHQGAQTIHVPAAEVKTEAPQIVVNVPPQEAPIVNVAPAAVTVDVQPAPVVVRGPGAAKVERNALGQITGITTNE